MYLILGRHVPDPENHLQLPACWCNLMRTYLILSSNMDHSTVAMQVRATYFNRSSPDVPEPVKVSWLWVKWPTACHRTHPDSHNCLFRLIMTKIISAVGCENREINGIFQYITSEKRVPAGVVPYCPKSPNTVPHLSIRYPSNLTLHTKYNWSPSPAEINGIKWRNTWRH